MDPNKVEIGRRVYWVTPGMNGPSCPGTIVDILIDGSAMVRWDFVKGIHTIRQPAKFLSVCSTPGFNSHDAFVECYERLAILESENRKLKELNNEIVKELNTHADETKKLIALLSGGPK